MTDRSEECYDKHLEEPVHKKGKFKGKPSGLSQCEKYWKCPTCYKVIRTGKRKKEADKCAEYLCNSCEQYVMEGHLYYLRSIPAKEHYSSKYIFV